MGETAHSCTEKTIMPFLEFPSRAKDKRKIKHSIHDDAAVVEQFGKHLSFLELEIPSPGAGQILVKSDACGVCHTDLHAAHGDWILMHVSESRCAVAT
jgi:hypothetical protein